jgi:sugar lactone lactonase YvrE
MRNRLLTGLALGAAMVLAAATPALAGVAVPDPGHLDHVRTVATFDPGDGGAFAESVTADGQGNLLVSLDTWGVYNPVTDTWTDNSGQLWRVAPNGTMTPFGPKIALGGCGQILGVAMNSGAAYVALYNFGPDPACTTYTPPSGVYRVTSTRVSPLMTLPEGSWPNGVTVHDGWIYATDSGLGAIWRGPVNRKSSPEQPWFTSDRLLGTEDYFWIGANGIAFRGDDLFVTSSAKGMLLRIVPNSSGKPVWARIVAQGSDLVSADGLVFDALGRAWIAVNASGEGSLVMVRHDGSLVVASTPANSLDYPTQAVIGCTGTVFVTNGSYNNGTPSLVAFSR